MPEGMEQVAEQPGVMSSNHPNIEALGQEGVSKGIDELSGRPEGNNQPGSVTKQTQVDPLAAMETKFKELQQKYDTEINRRFNGVDSYKHKVAKLENELKQIQASKTQPNDPEQAAVLAAQEKYVMDLIQSKYGLTPEMVQQFSENQEKERKMNTVNEFISGTKGLAGEDFDKLEPFAVKLVEEYWDKAMNGDPTAQQILASPGNLLWNAQRMFAESADTQNQEVNNSRTKAIEKNVTLKSGTSPKPARGKFSEKDLDSLSVKDLPELSKQIDEMERSRR
jgi:hypothetical protein